MFWKKLNKLLEDFFMETEISRADALDDHIQQAHSLAVSHTDNKYGSVFEIMSYDAFISEDERDAVLEERRLFLGVVLNYLLDNDLEEADGLVDSIADLPNVVHIE
jgi:hypothetical protein